MPHISQVWSWSAGDVVAGVTVAAASLPQCIAYAELAGLAGHRGVKVAGPPIVAFALATKSPSLCVGVTSITALMAHSALSGGEYKEAYGEERWMDLLGTFSVLVGIASLALALLGAARLARRIPGPVKVGWKLGFALTVTAAQTGGAVFGTGSADLKRHCALPAFLPGGGAAAMYRLGWVLLHPHFWHPSAAALTGLTFVIVKRFDKYLARLFGVPGLEVIAAAVAGTSLALACGYAGETVGLPPAAPAAAECDSSSGMASFLFNWVRRWPWEMPWAELIDLLGGLHWAVMSAVAFAGVDFLAILSVVPDSQPCELAGQGVGCVVSGMLGSAPIGGSLSRSMVAGMTGATSPLMGFVSGLFTMVLAFPQVGALLAPTPKAVLAAVVLAAVLPSVVWPKDMLRMHGADAVAAWATALATCLADPTKGFGVGLAVYALLGPFRAPLIQKDG